MKEKRPKKPAKPGTLKAKPLNDRKAGAVKGGRAGGGTQSEDEIYVSTR